MQLYHVNCESTDSEKDPENTVSINLKHVENDYERIMHEQPICSHIYQNHDQIILNYNTRPITINKTKEKIEKIVEEITEENPTDCSNTNKIYQNIAKEPQLQEPQKKSGQSYLF